MDKRKPAPTQALQAHAARHSFQQAFMAPFLLPPTIFQFPVIEVLFVEKPHTEVASDCRHFLQQLLLQGLIGLADWLHILNRILQVCFVVPDVGVLDRNLFLEPLVELGF